MNKLKRTLALVATLAVATTAFAACGKEEESSATSSAAGTSSTAGDSSEAGGDNSETPAAELTVPDTGSELTVLCWTDADLKNMIPCFAENSDYEESQIKWVECGSNGSDASEKYQQYFDSGEQIDLFVAESGWIMNYINQDAVSAPLSDLGLTEADFATNYSYAREIGKDSNGVLKGASWQAAAGGYAYRTSLADSLLGVKSADEMQGKIGNWEDFWAVAKTVYDESNGATAMVDSIGGLWQVFSYNRDSAWVDADNKLVLDDSCSSFLETVKSNYDAGYVSKIGQWDDAWLPQGTDGSVFGYFFSTWCLGAGAQLEQASGGTSGATYGDWTMCVGPCDYAWGGSWLCLSKTCDNGTLARDFIKFFCADAETMQTYASASGDFVNSSEAMDAIVAAGTNSNAALGGQDQFSVLVDAAAGIDMTGIITPYDQTIKDDYVDAVKKYCTGEYTSVDAALEGFQDSVASDLPDLNWD